MPALCFSGVYYWLSNYLSGEETSIKEILGVLAYVALTLVFAAGVNAVFGWAAHRWRFNIWVFSVKSL